MMRRGRRSTPKPARDVSSVTQSEHCHGKGPSEANEFFGDRIAMQKNGPQEGAKDEAYLFVESW